MTEILLEGMQLGIAVVAAWPLLPAVILKIRDKIDFLLTSLGLSVALGVLVELVLTPIRIFVRYFAPQLEANKQSPLVHYIERSFEWVLDSGSYWFMIAIYVAVPFVVRCRFATSREPQNSQAIG